MTKTTPDSISFAAAAKRSYLQFLASGSAGTWWSAVVVTASNARQADSFEGEIERRRRQGALPGGVPFLVVPDPEGRRLGSGGATLNALRQVVAARLAGAGTEALEAWWMGRRLLMLHSGGDTRRVPQYSLTGKLFGALPIKAPWGGASTVFDEFLALSTLWLEHMEAGLLVGSGDVLLDFDPALVDWRRDGVSGVALMQPAAVGSKHGVYVCGEDGRVYAFLQKPSLAEVEAAGGVGSDARVAVDTGLLRFDPAVAARLSRLDPPGSHCPPLDLYRHFAWTLTGQWRPAPGDPPEFAELHQALSGTSFACFLLEGEFTHIGTTAGVRSLMTGESVLSRLYQAQQRLGVAARAGLQSNGVVVDSALDGGEIDSGAIVLECHLEGCVHAARGSVLHGLTGVRGPVEVPEDTVVHQVFVRTPAGRTGTVIRVYGVADDPKKTIEEGATWHGRPLLEELAALGLDTEPVWPDTASEERCLWNASLFPIAETQQAWGCARWLLRQPDAEASAWDADRWAVAERCSLATSAQWADPTRTLEAQTQRSIAQWEASAVGLALAGSDIRPMLTQAPGLTALAAVARRLEESAREAAATEPTTAASRHYLASMFFAQAGLERETEQAREAAYAAVTEAVLRGAGVFAFPPSEHWVLREAQVTAPARIDFGGGWSDTPPFCLDWGGTVLNAAVALNGEYPIEAHVHRLDEPVLRFTSSEIQASVEIAGCEELQRPAGPGDPFAIPKTALRLSGLFPPDRPLSKSLERMGGGLEISTSVRLPMGSGLGTSSILAATVVQALGEMLGHRLSAQVTSDLVLQLEQAMSTGGGWQDQAGGIFPGVKLLSTGPDLVQRVRYQPLSWSLERAAELERRVVLISTGIARVARNLLQQVVGSYLARETAAVQVLHSIKTLALEMAHAMQDGAWDSLGALLDRHWALNQILDLNTTNAPIQSLLERVRPHVAGAKLAGAGGGGFLICLAKNEAEADLLRREFDVYDWQIARDGLRVKRIAS